MCSALASRARTCTRVCGVCGFNGTWRACVSRKGREEAAPACAREGVSTLGELPFRAGNNGMRVARRSTLAPFHSGALTNGCGKDGGFLSLSGWLASSVNTLKGEQRAGERASERVSRVSALKVHFSKILTLFCARLPL